MNLTVAAEGDLLAVVVGSAAGRLEAVVLGTLANTAGLLAGSGKAAKLAVLVDGVDDPVDAGIVADGGVLGINHDDFEVLVGSIGVDPVGVQDTQVTAATTDSVSIKGLVREQSPKNVLRKKTRAGN